MIVLKANLGPGSLHPAPPRRSTAKAVVGPPTWLGVSSCLVGFILAFLRQYL